MADPNIAPQMPAASEGKSKAVLQKLWLSMLTRSLWLIAGAIGAVMFVAGVGFDLVLFQHKERGAAIVISNLLVGLLAATLVLTLLAYGRQQRRLIMERLEALNEVNHHVRNALQALSFAAATLQGAKEREAVAEAIHRIQWALSDVLPKVEPSYESFEGSAREADAVRRKLN